MNDALDATVDAFAVFRLTRLVVSDTLFDEPRRALLERLDQSGSKVAHKISEGLECSWCVSIWAAGGVLVFKRAMPRAWRALSFVLATSTVAGILSGHEYQPDELTIHDDEPDIELPQWPTPCECGHRRSPDHLGPGGACRAPDCNCLLYQPQRTPPHG